jgi:hypothetical protein
VIEGAFVCAHLLRALILVPTSKELRRRHDRDHPANPMNVPRRTMASVGRFLFLLLFFCVSVCLLPIGSPGPVSANLRAIQPRAQRNVYRILILEIPLVSLRSEVSGQNVDYPQTATQHPI